jgi:iron-sulfur cluster assembly protein
VGWISTDRPGNPIRKEASPLLAITETAATAIKSLTASQEQPDEAGVRIAARETADLDTPDSLRLSVVEGPAEDDQVVEEHGAHVFLAPHAASYLDDKLLDANIDGQQVRFAISDQR